MEQTILPRVRVAAMTSQLLVSGYSKALRVFF